MKHKVSELTGALLDVAVAKAAGVLISMWGDAPVTEGGGGMPGSNVTTWAPSSDWSQGGPIKTREKIATWWDGEHWCATHPESQGDGGFYPCMASAMGGTAIDMSVGDGMPSTTELEAAMRCYVAAKLGNVVDLDTAQASGA